MQLTLQQFPGAQAVFETLTLPSLDIMILAARAVLLFGAFCVFALAFIRWRSADARSNVQLLQQLERTFAEVRTLHETVTVMSARLEALSENQETGKRLAAPSTAGTPRGYDIAARMAKNGTDAEGLIANCGLTRQEAELMVRLHGIKSSERTASATPRPTRPEPTRARQLPESRAATTRPAQVPVLQVPVHSAEQPAAGTRRRGSLVSAVG
jgi:hypothetical protein